MSPQTDEKMKCSQCGHVHTSDQRIEPRRADKHGFRTTQCPMCKCKTFSYLADFPAAPVANLQPDAASTAETIPNPFKPRAKGRMERELHKRERQAKRAAEAA